MENELIKHSKPLFKAWKPPPNEWAEWVNHLVAKYGAVWIKSGIFDSIIGSIYEIPCNHSLVSKLLQHWTPKTNTFVFAWGEATVTLEDVMILGGYSVLGESVDSVDISPGFLEKVEVIDKFRRELVTSKSRKASHSKWIQMFMQSQTEPEHEEIEHIAFLSLWLSRFVFPSGDQDSVGKHVIPIAVRLSQGVRLALAPAVLAYIYHNLTQLIKSNCRVNLLGLFQLVQIWGYERFPTIGPKKPNELVPGEPRLARWHMLQSNVSTINLESLIWRPYAVDLQNWKPPSYYQDSEQLLGDSLTLDDDLRSFACFITPCELNGLGCKADYHPQRVAMQFGFDQDIPGDMFSYESSKSVKLVVPSKSFRPGVTKRYSDWWKNGDQMDVQNECIDSSLEDGFVDTLVSLKKICNDTKRKFDSLEGSFVGVPQSTKIKFGTEVGKDRIDVILID